MCQRAGSGSSEVHLGSPLRHWIAVISCPAEKWFLGLKPSKCNHPLTSKNFKIIIWKWNTGVKFCYFTKRNIFFLSCRARAAMLARAWGFWGTRTGIASLGGEGDQIIWSGWKSSTFFWIADLCNHIPKGRVILFTDSTDNPVFPCTQVRTNVVE